MVSLPSSPLLPPPLPPRQAKVARPPSVAAPPRRLCNVLRGVLGRQASFGPGARDAARCGGAGRGGARVGGGHSCTAVRFSARISLHAIAEGLAIRATTCWPGKWLEDGAG